MAEKGTENVKQFVTSVFAGIAVNVNYCRSEVLKLTS